MTLRSFCFIALGWLAATACVAGSLGRLEAQAQDPGQPADSPKPSREVQLATKGYELYSWQEAPERWRYALLEGTNRLKFTEELSAAAASEDELRRQLSDLPAGERVTWCAPANFATELPLASPPQATVDSLLALAKDHAIQLRLCDP